MRREKDLGGERRPCRNVVDVGRGKWHVCACVCALVCCVCAVRDVGKLEMEVRVCAPPSSDTRGE